MIASISASRAVLTSPSTATSSDSDTSFGGNPAE